jgi:EAL domain-containing protein (putative c-di-GMP-specific phosphodiesterase class I)
MLGREPTDPEPAMGAVHRVLGTQARDDIDAAIERDELAPLFQPIVDLRTGLAVGYEALSRFMRGSRDVVSWFEQAHRFGLGARLEAHAVRCALSAPRRPFGAFLAINLSASGLVSPEVERELPDRLDGVVIELTGHGQAPEESALRAVRQELRARGARLAVDLAGSDYAGLRELMMVAPDILKLDRALVHRVRVDPVKTALVAALVGYGRELGITICAEGVEELDDVERLADLDVAYAQGYAIGRPARPWVGIDAEAARICTTSAAMSVTGASRPDALARDGRLQWLSWKLSEATSYDELGEAVEAIKAELGADEALISVIDADELVVVGRKGPDRDEERFHIPDYPETERLLREQDSVQIHVTDPDADPAEVELLKELGYRSLLMLPISCAGRAIGLFEAYSAAGRPFSRFEIGRARIIALQVGATLERIGRPA